jgi:hypothetical protein
MHIFFNSVFLVGFGFWIWLLLFVGWPRRKELSKKYGRSLTNTDLGILVDDGDPDAIKFRLFSRKVLAYTLIFWISFHLYFHYGEQHPAP